MTTKRSRSDPGASPPSDDVIRRLSEIVGPRHALVDPDLQRPYLVEWRDKYVGRTPLVLRPGSVEQVSRCLAIASVHRVAIVAQSGNTGLVGGQIPHDTGTEVVLSLERLRRIRSIDPAGQSMVVEAGLTLAETRAAAAEAGRLFPLSLPSEGSCRIGGILATNAGGAGVLAYGNTRDLVLGVEVVLADGRIWDGLRALRKDNSGYALKHLFIGSEGTLGIITAAVLKLYPRPAEVVTAMAALRSLDDALALFRVLQSRFGNALTAFEFIPDIALAFVTRHVARARAPFEAVHPWIVLVEVSSGEADGGIEAAVAAALAEAMDRGIVAEATIARSDRQARDLWRLREEISAAQKFEGGSIKHDVSVPIAAIPGFITRAGEIVERLAPGARPVPFGHFGDGNVHYNVSQPVGADTARFLATWDVLSHQIHELAVACGGSISAEHGIGRLKRDELVCFKSAVEIDLMRRIKGALDPDGILNPGKLL